VTRSAEGHWCLNGTATIRMDFPEPCRPNLPSFEIVYNNTCIGRLSIRSGDVTRMISMGMLCNKCKNIQSWIQENVDNIPRKRNQSLQDHPRFAHCSNGAEILRLPLWMGMYQLGTLSRTAFSGTAFLKVKDPKPIQFLHLDQPRQETRRAQLSNVNMAHSISGKLHVFSKMPISL
jgi:hypothetical protein